MSPNVIYYNELGFIIPKPDSFQYTKSIELPFEFFTDHQKRHEIFLESFSQGLFISATDFPESSNMITAYLTEKEVRGE